MIRHPVVTHFLALPALIAFAGLIGACSVMAPRPVTPISEVVSLGKGAQSGPAIDRIRANRTTYALRGSDFGKLADAGVSAPVLDYLQQSFYDEVDMLTRYWVLGESLGGCDRCYPQPVDLDELAKGGDGMADATNLARREDFSAPAGLPAWITANPGGAGAPTITVAGVEELVKAGTPAEAVVAQIENSRAHDYIAHQGLGNISTHFQVGLKGAELARLRKEGVPDAVLDAVQRKYLAEFIEFHRVRYQNWGKGPNPN